MYHWTVCVAWTPRDPRLEREKCKEVKIEAEDAITAILGAFKQAYGRDLDFFGCDYTQDEFEEQLESYDGTIDSAYFAELPVEGRGQYTFLVWSDDAPAPTEDE